MALPGFVGVGSVVEVSGSPAIGLTAGTVVAGDLLTAIFWIPGQGAELDQFRPFPYTLTPPDGWALIAKVNTPAPFSYESPPMWVYQRQVKSGADSGASWQWQINGLHGGGMLGVLLANSNAYGSEEVATTYDLGSSTTVNARPVITSRPNQLIYEVWVFSGGPGGPEISVVTSPATTRLSVNSYDVPSGSVANTGIVISEQPQTTAGTTPTKQIVLDRDAVSSTVTFSIYPNDAPDAPTLIAPSDTASIDVNEDQTFTWAFSDPDPLDTQSKPDLQTSADGGANWTTRTAGASTNQYWKAVAGTFTDGVDYLWRVRCYDSFGLVGPYSTASHFTGSTTPSGPTITNPTADEVIGESSVDVAWSFTLQEGYQVRLWPDNGSGAANTSGSPLFDSGQVIDGSTHDLTVPLVTTGVTRHVQVSIKSGGLWSAFVDRRFTVDYDAPPRATVTLTEGESTITVSVTTPLPTGGELTATSVDIEISSDAGETWAPFTLEPKSTGLAPSVIWTFWTAASDTDYLFRAKTYSDANTFALSDPADLAVIDMGIPPADLPFIPGGSP